jgi:hypothetical protein
MKVNRACPEIALAQFKSDAPFGLARAATRT